MRNPRFMFKKRKCPTCGKEIIGGRSARCEECKYNKELDYEVKDRSVVKRERLELITKLQSEGHGFYTIGKRLGFSKQYAYRLFKEGV